MNEALSRMKMFRLSSLWKAGLFLCLLLFAAGCPKTDRDRLIGRWVINDQASGWREECAFFPDGKYWLSQGTHEREPDRFTGRWELPKGKQGVLRICIADACNAGKWETVSFTIKDESLRTTHKGKTRDWKEHDQPL